MASILSQEAMTRPFPSSGGPTPPLLDSVLLGTAPKEPLACSREGPHTTQVTP